MSAKVLGRYFLAKTWYSNALPPKEENVEKGAAVG
jgi:hypothetical protein